MLLLLLLPLPWDCGCGPATVYIMDSLLFSLSLLSKQIISEGAHETIAVLRIKPKVPSIPDMCFGPLSYLPGPSAHHFSYNLRREFSNHPYPPDSQTEVVVDFLTPSIKWQSLMFDQLFFCWSCAIDCLSGSHFLSCLLIKSVAGA